mmetsp:Transcript_7278/g.17823  ORF Transcript_7278/g.17823 Transcript_7278/m.17823 type:complete len:276 (-) Transcript_7278:329-1156(-)
MVAVLVPDALEHMAAKLVDQRRRGLDRKILQCLLHNAAAVHMKRERQQLACDLFGNQVHRAMSAILEELLDHVVSENVRHEAMRLDNGLIEHPLDLLLGRILELLLNKTGPVLIRRKLDDLAPNLRELPVAEPHRALRRGDPPGVARAVDRRRRRAELLQQRGSRVRARVIARGTAGRAATTRHAVHLVVRAALGILWVVHLLSAARAVRPALRAGLLRAEGVVLLRGRLGVGVMLVRRGVERRGLERAVAPRPARAESRAARGRRRQAEGRELR